MAIRINTQILDPILREVVMPDVPIQFQEKPKLYQWMMEGKGEEVNSRGTRIPMYIKPSASNGWRSEGAKLPMPVADEDVAARVRYTRYRRAIELTSDALIHMDSATNLVKGLAKRIARHTASAKKEINQQLYGPGTGEVAVVDTPLTKTTVTVTNDTILFASTTALGSTHGVRKILVGGRYHWFSAAGVQRTGTTSLLTCVAISRSAHTATFDVAIPTDVVATDILVYEDSYNMSLRGLRYHVTAGSEVWQTLSRADYPDLRAVVVPANSAYISVALFSRLEHEMMYRSDADSDMGDDAIHISSPAQRYSYELLGHSMKRYGGLDTKFDGGFKEVSHNGRTWVIDVDCDHDKIYRLKKDALKKFELRKFGLLDDDGRILYRVPGFATDYNSTSTGTHFELWRAYLGMDCDIGSDHPSSLGVINSLAIANLPVGDIF